MNEAQGGRHPELALDVAGLHLRTPVMVASGTFGYGHEYAGLTDLEALGAVVVKGIRLDPWEGNPPPRMAEVRGGLVNSIGLQGPGVQGFIDEHVPYLRTLPVPVIVNVWGQSVDEYAEVCARLSDVEGVDALELNISCPNIKAGGIAFGTDALLTGRLVAAARRRTGLPLIVKLSPNVPDITVFVRAAEQAGADALSLINTLPAMVIDTVTRRPALGNVVGGLSGPAIHPVAVKLVWEAAGATNLPVIGMGGIATAVDAIEFFIAGASAVAVGTATFSDPATAARVVAGLSEYLRRNAFDHVRQLIGSLQV